MHIVSHSPNSLVVLLRDEEDTVALGNEIGAALVGISFMIHLRGDLGAGKTTLSRGIVQSFGHTGAVKSPTYTLVEPYDINGQHIYHFDLYRMASADELNYLGLEDYFNQARRLCLVEWPEKGEGVLPPADWLVELSYLDEALNDDGQHNEGKCNERQHYGRSINIDVNTETPHYEAAQKRLAQLAQALK